MTLNALENPYKNHPSWYKGQIHAHSNRSDGDQPPFDVEQAYRLKGYHFICLTDHNQASPDPEVPGILHITSGEDGDGWRHHILALGINLDKVHEYHDQVDASRDEDKDGLDGRSTGPCGNNQPRIDYITDIQQTVAVLAHPQASHAYLGEGWTLNELKTLYHYTGIELYNGDGPWSLDWWDPVLSCSIYKKVWGFGGDDCHDVTGNKKDFNRTWIVVNSAIGPPEQQVGNELLKEDLLENIKAGNFYTVVRSPEFIGAPLGNGSNDLGPTLKIRTFPGIVDLKTGRISTAIHVETDLPGTITFIAGYLCQPAHIVKKEVGVTEGTYYSVGHEDYIRVEVQQLRSDDELYRVFSQPLFIRKYFSLESFNYPNYYLCNRIFLVELSHPGLFDPTFYKDSSFRLVPALGDPHSDFVSFESINHENYYLRHQDFRLKLQPKSEDSNFAKDATFKMHPGLADHSCISFEAFSVTGYYIRHRDSHIYIEKGDSELFRNDATFRLVDPRCKGMVFCPG